MAKNSSWHGLSDSTPSSSPKTNAKDQENNQSVRGNAWKGLEDSTPSSSPKTNAKDQ